METEMTLAERIEYLRSIIGKSETGHLNLKYRYDLFRHINNNDVVMKLFCECCKKVYPKWLENVALSPELTILLGDINNYIYHNIGSEESINNRAEHLMNYVYQIDIDEDINLNLMPGVAVINLGFFVGSSELDFLLPDDEYEGEDDYDFDYTSWLPDYEAEMGFLDTEEDTPENLKLRKEYWNWYLDTITSLLNEPDKEIEPLPKPPTINKVKEIPERKQIKTPSSTVYSCLMYISNILKGIINDGTEWTEIKLCTEYLLAIRCDIILSKRDGSKSTKNLLIRNDICNKIVQIMKIMYSIAPEEGAWLRFFISVKPDGTFTTEFDYDGYDANRDPNMLVAAFVKYPRSRMYTPTWWEDILPYKTKYLVSKREKAAMLRIDLSEMGLTINGEKIEERLSSNLLVRAFGEEHLDTGFKLRTDRNGYKNRYAQKTYLKWEEAGIMAVRDEDDNSVCSAVYLQIRERNSTDTFYPSLSNTFIGLFTIDGKAVEFKKGMHLRKGKYEINVLDDGTGLLEIVCHNTRCISDSWREYRMRMEENMQLMFEAQTELRDTERAVSYSRECINEKDRSILLNRLSRNYLDYALECIRNGYAQGRSLSFLGGTFLSPVVEGITKCMNYGNVSFNEILLVIASCLLFKYDKGDLRKFAEILSCNGIADSVFDRMICRRIPEWTISDCTEFKAIDLWMEKNNTSEYTDLQSSIKLYFCSEVDCKIIFDAIISK